MQIQGSFDANQHAPKQLGASLPPGKYPFQISNTSIQPTKDNDGGMFVVEFSTPSGNAVMRYNLWNKSPQAVEIAHGQLSALCHAVGIFKIDYANEGAALRGAQGMLEIGWQKGNEPTAEKPEGGYTEVKRVFDKNGNEPGKPPANAPQPQQGNGQAWGGQTAQAQADQAAQGAQWGGGATLQPAQPGGGGGQVNPGWSAGPTTAVNEAPPWAKK